MEKKIIVIFMVAILVCIMSPIVAHAETKTVSNGQTLNLATCAVGDIVQIDAGATVKLTGIAKENVQVQCGAGVNLTLDNVTLNCTTDYFCALSFTGVGNTLNLEGTSQIKSGGGMPGIKVEGSTELTINKPGKLNAKGGCYGAGIGGGFRGNGGKITIKDGTVTAEGDTFGAGIGGGEGGDGGTVNISGGTVTATGGNNGAGIGSGFGGDGGTVTIRRGTVEVAGGEFAAGIGGGDDGNGGTVNISGGTVTAKAGSFAAGIGGGSDGNGGKITIEGGTVTVTGGYQGPGIGGGCDGGDVVLTGGIIAVESGNYYPYDIGHGNAGSGGTLEISGDASVLYCLKIMHVSQQLQPICT